MKLIVDECVGTSVVAYLCDVGHDVVAVVDAMPEADDQEILDRAVSEDRIVVTNDKDFGELVYRSGWEHRGVVPLRLRDERAENKVRMIEIVLDQVVSYGTATSWPLRQGSGFGDEQYPGGDNDLEYFIRRSRGHTECPAAVLNGRLGQRDGNVGKWQPGGPEAMVREVLSQTSGGNGL